jgi:hypothetical protein
VCLCEESCLLGYNALCAYAKSPIFLDITQCSPVKIEVLEEGGCSLFQVLSWNWHERSDEIRVKLLKTAFPAEIQPNTSRNRVWRGTAAPDCSIFLVPLSPVVRCAHRLCFPNALLAFYAEFVIEDPRLAHKYFENYLRSACTVICSANCPHDTSQRDHLLRGQLIKYSIISSCTHPLVHACMSHPARP